MQDLITRTCARIDRAIGPAAVRIVVDLALSEAVEAERKRIEQDMRPFYGGITTSRDFLQILRPDEEEVKL